MKTDDGVSDVIGSMLLATIIILIAGVITAFAVAIVAESAEQYPLVSFQQSTSPYYIYHAGGDVLQKSEIRIFYRNIDITDRTMIDGKSWDVWKTGDALYLTTNYRSELVTIVGRGSTGEDVILFEGMKKS